MENMPAKTKSREDSSQVSQVQGKEVGLSTPQGAINRVQGYIKVAYDEELENDQEEAQVEPNVAIERELVPLSRVRLNHPTSQVIGDMSAPIRTRRQIRSEVHVDSLEQTKEEGYNMVGDKKTNNIEINGEQRCMSSVRPGRKRTFNEMSNSHVGGTITGQYVRGKKVGERPKPSTSQTNPKEIPANFPSVECQPICYLELAASFERSPTPPWTSDPMISPDVEATITNHHVPGRNVVKVRPRPSPAQTNSEVYEEIAEEEAVCKYCFNVFKEENTLLTTCRCKNALIHEECAADLLRAKGNNNCDYCGLVVQNITVTLDRGQTRAPGVDGKKKSWLSSPLKRITQCFS